MDKILEIIRKINKTATEDFSKAQGMLEVLNDCYSFKLGFLNRRVVVFENPDLQFGAPVHDAVCYIKSTWFPMTGKGE